MPATGGTVVLAPVELDAEELEAAGLDPSDVRPEEPTPEPSTGVAPRGSTTPASPPVSDGDRSGSEPELSLAAEVLEPQLFDEDDVEDTLADLMPMDFDGEPAVPLASLQGPRPTTHPRLAKDLSIPRASLITATGSVEQSELPVWPTASPPPLPDSFGGGAQSSAETLPPGSFSPAPVRWIRSLMADFGASKHQVLRGLCIGLALSVVAVPLAQLYWLGSSPVWDWLRAATGAPAAEVPTVDSRFAAYPTPPPRLPEVTAPVLEARELPEVGRVLPEAEELQPPPPRGVSGEAEARPGLPGTPRQRLSGGATEELEESGPSKESAATTSGSAKKAHTSRRSKRRSAKVRTKSRRKPRAPQRKRQSRAGQRKPEKPANEPAPARQSEGMSPAESAGLSTAVPF